MKKIILTLSLSIVTILFIKAQNVGIGTNMPKHNFHIHNSGLSDVSFMITNGITGDDLDRGARFRFLSSDLSISNNENGGKISLLTELNPRLTINATGEIGIGITSPQAKLHINSASTEGLRLQGTNIFQSFYDGSNYRGYIQAWSDALSIGSTTGNAMRFYTESGVERMTILPNGRIGMGTPDPWGALHIKSFAEGSATLTLEGGYPTLSFIHDNEGKGYIIGNEKGIKVTGNELQFYNGSAPRMTIKNQNIGIGTIDPQYPLEIVNDRNVTVAIKNTSVSPNSKGLFTYGENSNYIAAFGQSTSTIAAASSNYSIGVHGTTGGTVSGPSYYPSGNSGVVGHNLNTNRGIGVFGISESPSEAIREAAVLGRNTSSAPNSYGIIGETFGATGAGTVGKTDNATAGLLGLAIAGASGPAILAKSENGTSKVGLELENSSLKVSGTNKMAFQVASAGVNPIVIPNTGFATTTTDILIVTRVGVAVNISTGYYIQFNGGAWKIYTENGTVIPAGEVFNILVFKQ